MLRKYFGECLVCDAPAVGVNFGVPTCMPCKAFFRRNALKIDSHELTCEHDGKCIITSQYRRACKFCRLAKCFRVGMKKSLILPDDKREARNKLVSINRLKRGIIPKQQCVTWMKPPSLLSMSSNPTQNLSSSDQTVLANIFHAYENTCIVAKNTQFHSFPRIPHTSIHEFFNEVSSLLQIFMAYFKIIPEFSRLIMSDKIRIAKSHFGAMININEPLLYSVTPTNLAITWTNVFNHDLIQRFLKRNQIIEQFLFDPIILRIVLLVVVLSSGNGRNVDYTDIDMICDDSLSILAAQNVYVELLWRYVVSRSPNWSTTIKFFNKLIMLILYVQDIDMHVDAYVTSLRQEIEQMEPIMRNMWPEKDDEEEVINEISIAQ